jgi:hypothetical protein
MNDLHKKYNSLTKKIIASFKNNVSEPEPQGAASYFTLEPESLKNSWLFLICINHWKEAGTETA